MAVNWSSCRNLAEKLAPPLEKQDLRNEQAVTCDSALSKKTWGKICAENFSAFAQKKSNRENFLSCNLVFDVTFFEQCMFAVSTLCASCLFDQMVHLILPLQPGGSRWEQHEILLASPSSSLPGQL